LLSLKKENRVFMYALQAADEKTDKRTEKQMDSAMA